jgi:hypothetical protein
MLPNSSGGIFDTVPTELPSSEQESDSIPSQSLTECGVTFQKPASSTAPAPAPVPTASTKQENNHDDNQNRFQTHSEVLLWADLVFEKFDRWRLEQSVQKRTQLNLTALDLHLSDADPYDRDVSPRHNTTEEQNHDCLEVGKLKMCILEPRRLLPSDGLLGTNPLA